ncbi:hypothetical protein CDD81_5880 [Ophiocordyceps australis]|uniref:Hydrophobin n=1 Tax=Ophiocordyceps australis TaxID=1399860 RepID=A0A2C5XM12_9HYPO|nr:hypothetical protein CDD81_5880 [Ophiocordyceps australis]
MKAFAVIAFLAGAFAMPSVQGGRGGGSGGSGGSGSGGVGGTPYQPCLGSGLLQSSANCCATDVLGLVDLNCAPPQELPRNPSHFQEICAEKGQQPRCCVLPVAGQALVCTAPVGI